jgi:hypothetical protein
MSTYHFSRLLATAFIGVTFMLTLALLLSPFPLSNVHAKPVTQFVGVARYVSTIGSDTANDCASTATPCRTVQHSVDMANDGDEIRIATGVYTEVNDYAGSAQAVYISKTIVVRGGYTTTDWTVAYPITQPTTLDAQGQGRVLYIIGDVSPTVEGLHITGGVSNDINGCFGMTNEPFGAGIRIVTATAVISQCEVFSNTTNAYGAGIFLANSAAVLTQNRIGTNSASCAGGGIYAYLSPANISGNIVQSNSGSSDGGGIRLIGSHATIENNVVLSNTAQYGGGLVVRDSDAAITENAIMGNTATHGGGLYLEQNSAALVSGNMIISNTAYMGFGGGLYLNGTSHTTLKGNFIAKNGGEAGGGVYLGGANVQLSENIISDNAAVNGGGLYLDYSNASLINNAIINNHDGMGAGGMFIGASSPQMLYNTVVSNVIYVTDLGATFSTVALTNSIIVSSSIGVNVVAGNSAILNGVLWNNNTVNYGGSGTVAVTHAITGDPAFAADGYHLTANSLAINQGVTAGILSDIDNEPRPITGSDLGADEYNGAPNISITPLSIALTLTENTNATQSITIANTGGVTLTWSLTETPSVPWLSETPVDGSVLPGNSAVITMTFNTLDLAGGTYTTILHFTSNDPDQPIVDALITLTLPLPNISVTPTNISITLPEGVSAAQTITIANTGSSTLAWNVAEVPTVTWLSETPSTGNVTPAGDSSITATSNAIGLPQGTYTTTLRFTSNDPDQPTVDVPITLTLPPPDINVIPTSIVITLAEGLTATQSIMVANLGQSTLTWNVTELLDTTWLAEFPTSGSVAIGSNMPITVILNTTGLSSNVYTTTLCFTSNDPAHPEMNVPIRLSVPYHYLYLPLSTKNH